MKRILTLLLAFALVSTGARAVLKEKDLGRTLGVLRAELATDYEKMREFVQMYEQQAEEQHQQLVGYMAQCEQIGLMLYSQSTDNIFDMAYACQQASALYRELQKKQNKKEQYDRVVERMRREMERYDDMIVTLRSMPPIDTDTADSLLSESDSILLSVIDSLGSGQAAPLVDEAGGEPLYLEGQQLKDREACVKYAQAMRDNLQTFLSAMEEERVYYHSVQDKAEKLNKFAQSRYKVLQDNIFKNGDANYFSVLGNLPTYVGRMTGTLESKYKPLEGHEQGYSEWRGVPVLSVSVFLVFYLAISLAISYAALRWLLPKRWRAERYRLKRTMLNNVVGIALFAVIVMVVRSQVDRSSIQMGTELVINMAWLMEVIFLSLFIRLKDEQMMPAVRIYTPLMLMAFVVILFRIVLMPTVMTNLIYPPILLAFALWQFFANRRRAGGLPALDRVFANICTAVMVVSCVMAWAGYSLMAVQVMIWWTFQFAAIMTVTCLYDLMNMFEVRFLVFRLHPGLKVASDEGKDVRRQVQQVLEEMKKGRHFGKTWFYDLVNTTLVPILAVGSVILSVYQAGGVFEMTEMFMRSFVTDFIDQEGLIQVSLYKLCIVVAMWFVFRYLNYAVHSIYQNFKRSRLKAGDTLNTTMANNVIAIIFWGLYAMITLVILHVPRSGISVVGAGLATGLGFAMQSIIENFFYGISLMAGRLRVGDFIECDGVSGRVESITYQSTQIITADGCVIAFLNSALFSKNFKNRTRNHHYELTKIPFSVAYGTDVEQVRGMVVSALTPIREEKNRNDKLILKPEEEPYIVFSEFGSSSVDLLACVWILVEEKIGLTARIKELIYDTLNANGIEIPFPQTDVHIRK